VAKSHMPRLRQPRLRVNQVVSTWFVFLTLSSIILLTTAASGSKWWDGIYDQVKIETIKGLEQSFNAKVTVGKVSGPLVGQVLFEDVKIEDFALAQKIYVDFNPVVFALKRDVVPAITSIKIVDANFKIVRDEKGQINAAALLKEAKPGDPPPPPFTAKIIFEKCSVDYQDTSGFAEKFGGVKGEVSFKVKNKIYLSLLADNQTKITGFSNYTTGNFEINVEAGGLKLSSWGPYLVPLKELRSSQGLCQAKIKLTPAALKGDFKISQGRFYNQDFAAKLSLNFAGSPLVLVINELSAYQGKASGTLMIDTQGQEPKLSLKALINNLDLASLSQNSPGIEGKASGELKLSGPITSLKGSLSTQLKQGLLFGQPIKTFNADFSVSRGDLIINNCTASSQNSFIKGRGTISAGSNYNFQAEAQGIKIKGQGLLGPMEAIVDSFEGEVGWHLDDKFLAAPLKNLTASGEVRLSAGQIGEQRFSQASGTIAIGQGLITINNASLKENGSAISISGTAGLGQPTELHITGQGLKLENLKIINQLLPVEFENPRGEATLDVDISGQLDNLKTTDDLFKLNASGTASIIQGTVASIPIEKAGINFKWQDRQLSFPDCQIKTAASDIKAKLALLPEDKLKGELSGTITLDELRKLTGKYGTLAGKVSLNLQATGSWANPQISTSFWGQNIHYNGFNFDTAHGSIAFANDLLYFSTPLELESGKNDKYKISGQIDFSPIRLGKPEGTFFDLNLELGQAELAPAINLGNNIYKEISRRLMPETKSGKVTINKAHLTLPSAEKFTSLYSTASSQEAFLPLWQKSTNLERSSNIKGLDNLVKGSLSGKISLKGKLVSLAGNFDATIKNGQIKDYEFDSFSAKGKLGSKKVILEEATLSNKGGELKLSGDINFSGTLSLEAAARKLPLDILKTVINKDFAGEVNLNAKISGPIQNPNFTASAASANLTLAGIAFEQAELLIKKDPETIQIANAVLVDKREVSSFEGWVKPDSINITADLKGKALGLFSLFTDETRWQEGRGRAKLTLSGSPDQLLVNGTIRVTRAKVYVRALDSSISQVSGEATISDSQLTLSSLTGIWQGDRTKNYQNQISLSGTIGLKKLFAPKNMVELGLSLAPNHFYVDLPNLFTGEIKVNQASLTGPSNSAQLTANAEINNTVIYVGKQEPDKSKALPLGLNLDVKLDKNVYVSMGDIATFDFSTIFMNLEIKSDEFKLLGTLKEPLASGKIELKRGMVNIFNKEFTLLTEAAQKSYYPFNNELVKENQASFSPDNGILPEVSITAKVDIENMEIDPITELKTKKMVTVVSRINGLLGTKRVDRALTIDFDSFVEQNNAIMPGSYSEQEVKVMLLPDFIKSLAGEEGIEANLLVSDYLSSRLQTFVFRGLERDLENRLGLESLTLEYNFGKKMRENMGVKDTGTFEQRPDWRVGFVKGFFDKLYIDLRYSQTLAKEETNSATTSFDTQITYKLSPIWSIIYYVEQPNVEEPTFENQKWTLQVGFSFW